MNKFPITKKHPFWKDIGDEQWNDWHWQQSNRITKIDQLKALMQDKLSEDEIKAFEATSHDFMMGITPYYASLIDFGNKKDPMRLQAVPQPEEMTAFVDELNDPLGEEHDMPVPGLTHRYPDRVLFYTTHNCPVYCRHCTRKRKVSDPHSMATVSQIELGLQYLRNHKEVRDVVVSGGDPLSLSDDKLFKILSDIQDIPHIDMMRLGTRNMVTLPQRVTVEFAEGLKRLNERVIGGRRKPIYVNTHFNNPGECSAEAAEACHRIVMAGSPLGNQAVLLKDVNDDPKVMKHLNIKLLSMGVKPYYIYLCDPVAFTAHFRTSVESGLEIIDNIRGHTSGFATPQLVIDAPSGGGKTLIPNGFVARHVGEKYTVWKITNFERTFYYYLAPNDTTDYFRRYNKPAPPDFDLEDAKDSYLKEALEKGLIE